MILKFGKPYQKQIFQSVTIILLILASTLSFLHLPTLTLQIQADENTLPSQTSNQPVETNTTDINKVETDEQSTFKFGQRIESAKFEPKQIYSDICGQSLFVDSTSTNSSINPQANATSFKFDPNVASTVIKSLKSTCPNSQLSENWLKMVWDNGLIGWVKAPVIQTVTQTNITKTNQEFETAFSPKSVVNSAATDKKTCKDFEFQVWSLKTLNEFPNLDLDDDGVGCEHLPLNQADQVPLNITDYDTNQDNNVTCADFQQKVYDSAILALFKDLDRDGDGIGCESNKSNPNQALGQSFDPNSTNFVDIENLDFELNLDENGEEEFVDLADLSKELMTVLYQDFEYLQGDSFDCNVLTCPIKQSLSALGRKGLWTFHFVAGILQGAGQSIVDLLTQVWELATKTGQVITEIVESVKALISDPKVLLQLMQDDLLDSIKLDTMGRANKMGQRLGAFVPDVVAIFVTAGVATVAKNAISALKNSTKFASAVIKVEKWVGKTVKILKGKYSLFLKRVGSGVGVGGKDALKLAKEADELDFEKILVKVKKPSDKEFLKSLKQAFLNCTNVVANNSKSSNYYFNFQTSNASNLCNFVYGYKHYPPKNQNWQEIIKSTVSGPAKYKPGVSIPELEKLAIENGIKSGDKYVFYKSKSILGSASGKETQFVRINISGGTYHGFPIARSKIPSTILKELDK